MKNMLRKYWFVLTITVLLVAFIGLFIYNENKDKLAGKKVDNQDVVAEFNGKNIFADDVYNNSKETKGSRIITMMIIKELVNQVVADSDEIKSEVAAQKEQIIANFKAKNATGYEAEIGELLQQVGFSNGFKDLDAYVTTNIKNQKMIEDYIIKHADTYLTSIDEKQGRTASHILVKFPTLTDEEKAGKTAEEIEQLQLAKNESEKSKLDERMAEIDKELSTKSFAEVAGQYSDDTGSKVANGSLGYVNNETSFVKEFLDATLALKEGEVSDWVKTTYGYHKIKVDATGKDKLLAIKEVKAQIINDILQKETEIYAKALKEVLEKVPVTSEDPTVKKALEALTK